MSGLGEIGELPGFAFGGAKVQPSDIDMYTQYEVQYPVVNAGWFGTVNSSSGGSAAVIVNKVPDYWRNVMYSVTGIAAGVGGTFTFSYITPFGSVNTETGTIGSANGGGTQYGTGICAEFIGGTFAPITTGGSIGTAAFGLGSASGSTGNWFGFPTKIGGTKDLRALTWGNNGTITAINGGSSMGTLVNITSYAFQGTSGVKITDYYSVIFVPNFDNKGKGNMSIFQP